MSSATQTKKDEPANLDFVLGKVGGKFVRFADTKSVPEGVEVLTLVTVEDMPKEKIGELYGAVVGVNAKTFKDKKIAIASLAFQVSKMPIYDAAAPKAQPQASASGVKEPKAARKSSETFELLSPADADKALKLLAPQARELVLIMIDLAKEKGSTTFSSAELDAKLKVPEVGERLHTKQDPARILAYYKGRLIGSGLIRTS